MTNLQLQTTYFKFEPGKYKNDYNTHYIHISVMDECSIVFNGQKYNIFRSSKLNKDIITGYFISDYICLDTFDVFHSHNKITDEEADKLHPVTNVVDNYLYNLRELISRYNSEVYVRLGGSTVYIDSPPLPTSFTVSKDSPWTKKQAIEDFESHILSLNKPKPIKIIEDVNPRQAEIDFYNQRNRN